MRRLRHVVIRRHDATKERAKTICSVMREVAALRLRVVRLRERTLILLRLAPCVTRALMLRRDRRATLYAWQHELDMRVCRCCRAICRRHADAARQLSLRS